MKLKNKKVLVTGACGFIGSHLVERLLDEGCAVRAFVFYNSFNSWGWLDTFPKDKLKEIDVFPGDVRDPHGVAAAARGADIVFHLAALIGIPYSYHSPDSCIETNIKGTLNILTACRDLDVERVVITSTSEVYGTARYTPIDERHPLQGQSPYSATKIGADAIAESFYRSFGMPVTVARPFNTYGPRQSARAVIPTVITQLLSGASSIKLGSLHPTRDFVFVEDTVEGFVKIAKADAAVGEVVNIASQSEISIGALAKKIISKLNPDAKVIADPGRVRPEKSEVERLLGSNKKIRKITGWRPRYSIDEGLDETIAWFKARENSKSYKSDIYNV